MITVIKTHDLVQAEKEAGWGPKDGKSRAAWDGSRSEETNSGGGRTRRVAESRSEPEEDRQGKELGGGRRWVVIRSSDSDEHTVRMGQ